MSGPKKPNAVFRVGDQAWALVPQYGKGVRVDRVLVDVVDAKRTYVVVKAVDPGERLHPDKTEYHMETGTVRNRDRFGNYAPRLITVAEHEINERTSAAHRYLEGNGIFPHELRGFWKDMGPIALADVLKRAEADRRALDMMSEFKTGDHQS